MSRRGSRKVGLEWRADQLEEALGAGGDELDPQAVAQARRVLAKVRERWALKGGRTVVALAGATGSGKSSLFNRLAGAEVATIGARRPTTSRASAAVWGQEDAGPLLDWLGVPVRHQVPDGTEGAGALEGLVLIDLPDFDSTETSHRVEADRILERADVFVWVTDPQKYADARLHDDYLRPLQHHENVMVVVLNQTDRLPDEQAEKRVREDLARLVRADGAGEFEVIGTSARIGTGLDRLSASIAEVVARRNAAEQRLVADLRGAATELLEGVAPADPDTGSVVDADVLDALRRAAGIPVVLDAVRRDYLRQAGEHVGWPFTRWVAVFRPDPLRRLRLQQAPGAAEAGITASDVGAVLGRSSLPPPTPAARSAVQLATRQVAERTAAGLPPRWAEAVAQAAAPQDGSLADALDQAVMATPLRVRNPAWWQLFNVLQFLFALTAIAGLGWLAVLAGLGFLQVPAEAPMWGPLPAPLVLLVGGVLAGLLFAALGRALARVGSRRRRRLIGERLDGAVSTVATTHIGDPVTAVVQRHAQTRAQLQAAVG